MPKRTLYTLPEAAVQLGVSRHTLSLQVRLGKLRAEKVGRDWLVSESEIARYRSASLGRHQGKSEMSETPEKSENPLPARAGARTRGREEKSEIAERFGAPRPAPKPGRKSETHRSTSAK